MKIYVKRNDFPQVLEDPIMKTHFVPIRSLGGCNLLGNKRVSIFSPGTYEKLGNLLKKKVDNKITKSVF